MTRPLSIRATGAPGVGASVGAVALALIAAACGAGSQATRPSEPATTAPTRTVTLWVDVPLAGAAAQEGRQMLDAVRLVVAQSNFRIGNIGVQVRASDDADAVTGYSDLSRCRAGARRAAADSRAIAVVGTYESSCTRAALPTLSAARLALVSPVNTDPLVGASASGGQRVLIRLAPQDSDQGAAAAAEASAIGAHRIYVLSGRSARAKRMQRTLTASASAPAARLAIVGDEPVPATGAAVRGLVARMRAAHADAVWIGAGAGPGVVALLHALAAPVSGSRSSAPRLAVIASDALYRDGLLHTAGADAEGLHLTSGFVPPDALGGAGADFVDAYARQFGQPGLYTAYAADAARLVLAALRRSDGTRAGMLRALLSTRSYPGLIGKVAIGPTGGSTLARLAVFQVRNGSFRFERTLDLGRS